MINYFNSIETNSNKIIYDIKKNIEYELIAYKKNQGTTNYDSSKESINILLVHFPAMSAHEIPRSYFNDKLPAQVKNLTTSQLKSYFSGLIGENRASRIAVEYLNDLLLIANAQEQEVIQIENAIQHIKRKIHQVDTNASDQTNLSQNYRLLLKEFLETIQ